MGLGPNDESLLHRCATPLPPWTDSIAMEIEQMARSAARQEKADWYATKARAPKKIVASATPLPKRKGQDRLWTWNGETDEKTGMLRDALYTAPQIRAAGYKLPAINEKKKGKKNEILECTPTCGG